MQLPPFSLAPRSVESLRKKAKQLLKAYHDSDESVQPLIRHLHRMRSDQPGSSDDTEVTLQQIQFCLAREYGSSTWAELIERIEHNRSVFESCVTELRHFLDADGLVKAWPAKNKKQKTVIRMAATLFVPGRRYTESEVNTVLRNCHSFNDPALLRRGLIEYGYLERERDCSSYWVRIEEQKPTSDTSDESLD